MPFPRAWRHILRLAFQTAPYANQRFGWHEVQSERQGEVYDYRATQQGIQGYIVTIT